MANLNPALCLPFHCFEEIRQLADALASPNGGPAQAVNEKNIRKS